MTEQYSNGLLDYFKDPYVDCDNSNTQSRHSIAMDEAFKKLITIADRKPLNRFQIANIEVIINKHFELKHRHCTHEKISAFTHLKRLLSHLFG